MATIHNLADIDVLHTYETELFSRDRIERKLYFSSEAMKWLIDDLPGITELVGDSEASPAEQLDSIVYRFSTNKSLHPWNDIHILSHSEDGVWELKTKDIRLFGYFAEIDCFVICYAESKDRLLQFNWLYGHYIRGVKEYRSSLEYNDPKFVSGGALDDVLSYPY